MEAVTVRTEGCEVLIEQEDSKEEHRWHSIRLHHGQIPLLLEWLKQAAKAIEDGE